MPPFKGASCPGFWHTKNEKKRRWDNNRRKQDNKMYPTRILSLLTLIATNAVQLPSVAQTLARVASRLYYWRRWLGHQQHLSVPNHRITQEAINYRWWSFPAKWRGFWRIGCRWICVRSEWQQRQEQCIRLSYMIKNRICPIFRRIYVLWQIYTWIN